MKIICSVYNGFLVQQNRDTGMPTYFLPMAPGSRKTWGSRTRDFWCCFGTMIQAQTLYPELIWYTDDSDVFVSQYIPSEVELELSSGSVHLTQCIHIKNYDNQVLFDDHCGGRVSRWSIRFTVCSVSGAVWSLKLRIPSWCAGYPEIRINGVTIKNLPASGCIELRRA